MIQKNFLNLFQEMILPIFQKKRKKKPQKENYIIILVIPHVWQIQNLQKRKEEL
jgi:hypothetical protein